MGLLRPERLSFPALVPLKKKNHTDKESLVSGQEFGGKMGSWPEVSVPGEGVWSWKEKQKCANAKMIQCRPRSTRTEEGGLRQTGGDRPRSRTLRPWRDAHS